MRGNVIGVEIQRLGILLPGQAVLLHRVVGVAQVAVRGGHSAVYRDRGIERSASVAQAPRSPVGIPKRIQNLDIGRVQIIGEPNR